MFDRWLPPSQDHLPLTWWRQQPVYLSAILALVAAASMILTAVLGAHSLRLAFTHDTFFREYHLWTPFTYLLVNPPDVWTAIGCFLLWRFGEAVERHIGRRAFVQMLVLLWLIPPVIISVCGITGIWSFACWGVNNLEFAVFVAFATLYAHAQVSIIILTLDAWVLAAILLGINALQRIAARDWTGLLLLLAETGAAHLFIRHIRGDLQLPSLPKPALKPAKVSKPTKPAAPGVDDILDKISHQGMHSLTAEERRILDKASEEMKRRAR
ncbi:MAG: hypothetical protein JNG86_01020 [Verrucomicrobiaceae bacterium]|nr:hypothetical protein [Verrucomicrobiaceae bacterium]